MTMSYDRVFEPGTRLVGKWNGAEYRIERALGAGANGKVYLVRKGAVSYALKMGFDAADHQSEVNVLKALSASKGAFSGYLIDVDDYRTGGADYPFYVMKYVNGVRISEFIRQRGEDWIGILGLNLLKKLAALHAGGCVFGDLKEGNVLVSGYGSVELIDFGGVSDAGRSVKQFTEVYDRGYWNAGSRVADERYDLFAFAVLWLHATGGARECFSPHVLPQNRTVDVLEREIAEDVRLRPYAPLLHNALRGEFGSSQEALAAWKRLLYERGVHPRQRAARATWLQAAFGLSVLLLGTVVYVLWQ